MGPSVVSYAEVRLVYAVVRCSPFRYFILRFVFELLLGEYTLRLAKHIYKLLQIRKSKQAVSANYLCSDNVPEDIARTIKIERRWR